MTATLSPRWARLLAVALASTLISALLFALPAWAHEGEHGEAHVLIFTKTTAFRHTPGGYANAAAQDSFCANTTCLISIIYDQLFGMLFILPGISGLLLPDSWSDAVTPYLPSNAGSAFTAVTQSADQLSPWAGLAVFCTYLAVTIAAAAWRLKNRDA